MNKNCRPKLPTYTMVSNSLNNNSLLQMTHVKKDDFE